MRRSMAAAALCLATLTAHTSVGQEWWKPYSPPCTERESVFAFTQKPAAKLAGKDRYEITFAVKGYCDVTVAIIDAKGKVVRHLGSGVLGRNAPPPFQKSSLRQTIHWNGKDDLDVYPRHPDRLRVRVMLGLKPVFDKRLGGASPKALPGSPWGIAVGPDGAYVITHSEAIHHIRRFDLNGNYIASLIPPSAGLPNGKLKGLAYVEYEKGVRAIHGPSLEESVSRTGGSFLAARSCQPALAGGRLCFTTGGSGLKYGSQPSVMYYVHTDGSTDLTGMRGVPLIKGEHLDSRLAAAPDGKTLYMTGLGHAVQRITIGSARGPEVFAGAVHEPGSSNARFNTPSAIACDASGRVYVGDLHNNRVQVLSPGGRRLAGIKVLRPAWMAVHQRTGALYVLHGARVRGKSVGRLSKFSAFPKLEELFHVDGFVFRVAALDSWSSRPRIWMAGRETVAGLAGGRHKPTQAVHPAGLTIWEEQGRSWKRILDFEEEARKKAGDRYFGPWSGGRLRGDKVVCDPTREVVYYLNRYILDLKTGRYLGSVKLPHATDDIAFDKRGYLHAHFNPGFYVPGVGRLDPSRPKKERDRNGREWLVYPEVPYDHGVQKMGPWRQPWSGVLPVKDQRGAKYFQDGIGVNMRGDVAEQSNVYYVPRMEDAGVAFARAGINERIRSGGYIDKNQAARFERHIAELKRRGEDIYFIRRRPGLPSMGGTIWTFDATGELRKERAVTAGDIVNGAMIDEDRSVYFVTARPRMAGDRYFLRGRGGTIGDPADKRNRNPFTGTLIKSKPDTHCRVVMSKSAVPMDPLPDRPPDLMHTNWAGVSGKQGWSWVEGHEWLYAGASPIVSHGCSCPTQRMHLDWFKRSYVPEVYRHSIGVVDAAGNLILHAGRYGNFDGGSGPKSRIPVGGDGIGCYAPRFISGTDNFLVFEDRGERLVVLKLNYHAEETVSIGGGT